MAKETKNPAKKTMEIDKETAIKLNKGLAILRQKEWQIKQRDEKEAENKIKKEIEESIPDAIVLLESELSNTAWTQYTDDHVLIKKTVGNKGKVNTRIVYRGMFNPLKKLNIDGNHVYEIVLQERIIGNVRDILNIMRSEGGVVSSNDLSDCVNALLSDEVLPTERGHSAHGVYCDDEHLSLCMNPYSITDEQRRIAFEVQKAVKEPLTRESLQVYADVLQHWHDWEIFPVMSFGIMSPFAYVLREKNILFPYLWHSSPENGLGKSLTAKIYSQHLFGVKAQYMGSVASEFRLADAFDAFCGLMTIDEAVKFNWNGMLGEKIKQSAENPVQDKRGSSDKSTKRYLSRLVGCFTGNSFPVCGKPDLVRFIRIEFDSAQKTIRTSRKNSVELTKKIRKLRPIGFRLVEEELKDINYDIDELIRRIETHADEIVKYHGSFTDARRATVWGIVYEGLRTWERAFKKNNIAWSAPTIKEFVRHVLTRNEATTFESKRIPVEDFLDWFEMYRTKDGDGYSKTVDVLWKCHTLECNNEEIPGIVVTNGILKEYNKANKDAEIQNMGDLARGVSTIFNLPLEEIYGKPSHYRGWKFGSNTKRGVFIKTIYTQDGCNNVTENDSTGEKEGYIQTEMEKFEKDECNQLQQEKNDESYMVTSKKGEQNNQIDLAKYEMTMHHIEEIVGDEHLFSMEIAKRMGKNTVSEIDFIEGLLKRAVGTIDSKTTLRVDAEGRYFNEKRSEKEGNVKEVKAMNETQYRYKPIFALMVAAEDADHALRRCKDVMHRLHLYEKDLELLEEMPEEIVASAYGLDELQGDDMNWYRMFLLLPIVMKSTDMAKNQIEVYSRIKEFQKHNHMLPLYAHIEFCDGTHEDEIEEVTVSQ